jgi:hypothetical protein
LQFYGGEDWLDKHSSYRAFARSLPQEHRDYFVFCSIRNPLEDIVSIYNIYRTNASGRALPEFYRNYRWYIRRHQLRRAKFFSARGDKSFQEFFRRFFRWPYVKPRVAAELHHARFDYVIRVEKLQDEFAAVLERLGLRQVRPVPVVNRCGEDSIDLDSYYPEEIRRRAVRIVGPMMDFMGYRFPDHWNEPSVPQSSRLYFAALRPFAAWFWNNVPYLKGTSANVGRSGISA